MLIGYELLRENSTSREIEFERVAQLKQAGCQHIFIDSQQGDKKELEKALSSLKSGDVLLVNNFRIFGDTRFSFLQNLVLLKKKGAYLQSLEDNCLLTGTQTEFDLVISLFPEKEEHCGNTSVRKTQKKRGRPKGIPKEKLQLITYLKAQHQDISIAKLCRLVKISRPTYYKYLS